MDFDYSKHIWQIQFRLNSIYPHIFNRTITIDYPSRLLTVNNYSEINSKATVEVFPIGSPAFNQLLCFSEISAINEFEQLSRAELEKLETGYWDECVLSYTYFTKQTPPIHFGHLKLIYKNNPIEEIINWIIANFPNLKL